MQNKSNNSRVIRYNDIFSCNTVGKCLPRVRIYATPASNRVASREILVKSTKDQPGFEPRPTWELLLHLRFIKMTLICLWIRGIMAAFISLYVRNACNQPLIGLN